MLGGKPQRDGKAGKYAGFFPAVLAVEAVFFAVVFLGAAFLAAVFFSAFSPAAASALSAPEAAWDASVFFR